MSSQAVVAAAAGDTTEELINRIGQLMRQMLESMRELGLDKDIARAAQAVPDARDRLNYVALMTERAAERVLNAIDVARPIQNELSDRAQALNARWQAARCDLPLALAPLLQDTRDYLCDVPQQAQATNAQLTDIMMAQDFQDLTGQVIKKLMDVIHEIETQLLKLLVDYSAVDKKVDSGGGLLNGPSVRPGACDTLQDQTQVDDLLANLGF